MHPTKVNRRTCLLATDYFNQNRARFETNDNQDNLSESRHDNLVWVKHGLDAD